MTSLRIALKQSLEESTPLSSEDTADKRPRNRTRLTDSARKKRGRPRKTNSETDANNNSNTNNNNDDFDSSSENEFSETEQHELDEDGRVLIRARNDDEEEEEEDSKIASTAPHRDDPHDDDEIILPEQHETSRSNFSSAASKIQSHWKKKKVVKNEPDDFPAPKQPDSHPAFESNSNISLDTQQQQQQQHRNEQQRSGRQKNNDESSNVKGKPVQAPVAEVLQWSRSLPIKRSRRNVTKGMRVKVRFATKVKREGKMVRKKKWYGGRVTAVSKEGSKIRIKYDDGTSEVTKFPDKDVVIDDTMNGEHECAVDIFVPPPPTSEDERAKAAVDAAPDSATVNTEDASAISSLKFSASSPPVKDKIVLGDKLFANKNIDDHGIYVNLEKSNESASKADTETLDTSRHSIATLQPSNQDEETSEKAPSTSKLTIRIPNIKKEGVASGNNTPRSPMKYDTSDVASPNAVKTKKRVYDGDNAPPAKRLHIHIQSPKLGKDVVKSTEDMASAIASPDLRPPAEVAEVGTITSPPPMASPKPRKHKIKKRASSSEGRVKGTEAAAGISATDTALPIDEGSAIKAGRVKKGDRQGRRAAQQANERIVSKQDSDGNVDSTLLKKKRKKEKRLAEDDGRKIAAEEDSQWVRCDGCNKWRIIPGHAVASLPKRWYCANNIWDPKRSSCDAPEQSSKQTAKQLVKEKRRRKRQKMLMQGQDETPTSQAELSIPARDVTLRSRSVPTADRDSYTIDNAMSSDETSQQIGKPDRFLGSRSRSQGAVGALDAIAEDSSEPVKKGRGRPRRNQSALQESEYHRENSSHTNTDEAENLEWVQCEKCDKWRKLPPHISADELPDVWYCSMNTWNPSSASCDAPEDKADGLQDIGVFGSSGIGGGKLSYRNLIFGQHGRKGNRTVSERTRVAESIFSTPDEDPDAPPLLMYANSSVFQTRKTQNTTEENDGLSFLDLMQNSNLWSGLKNLATVINNRKYEGFGSVSGRPAHYSLDMLPEEIQESIRDIVLQALGTQSLKSNEVLTEITKMSWDHAPEGWMIAKQYCCKNVIIMTLCDLYKEGVLDCLTESSLDWDPRYRRANSGSVKLRLDKVEAPDESPTRHFKFKKPKKHAIAT